MTKSPCYFAEILAGVRPRASTNVGLTNLTFFTGAGFSKSWDENFPMGDALFSFEYEEWNRHGGALEEFLSLCNYDAFELKITASLFKDIVYQISMMRKYQTIRPRYVDDQNLDMVERHLRYLVRKKFEEKAPIYYQDKNLKLKLPFRLNKAQRDILRFFDILQGSSDGSSGLPEGLRSNYISTNYDNVLEAILDRHFGLDDSYSLYTYRGITPSLYGGKLPTKIVHDNWLVSNLLKINGGFEVFKVGNEFELDYRQTRSDDQLRKNPPQLMLPSREQDYTQVYFHAMFPKVIRLLHETQIFVVVGYSMPEEDALLRLIIKQFAEDRADGSKKILFYVDKCSEQLQVEKINSVFPHAGETHGLKVFPYSGSFGGWCAEVAKKYNKITK